MSTTTETPELDAAIAEAELTEDEAVTVRELVGTGGLIPAAVAHVLELREAPEGDDDDDAPPEPDEGEPTAKQLDALGKELARHEKRVHEVMGGFVRGYVPCDACSGIGLVAPGPPAPEPRANENFKTCDTCDGFGLVLTGSLREGHNARDCPRCNGRGYLERLSQGGAPAAPVAAAPASSPAPIEATPPANGSAAPAGGDEWGVPSWMGDPAIGA